MQRGAPGESANKECLDILDWDQFMQLLERGFWGLFKSLMISRAFKSENSLETPSWKSHSGEPGKTTGFHPNFLIFLLLELHNKNLPVHGPALPAWWEGDWIPSFINDTTQQEKVPGVSLSFHIPLAPLELSLAPNPCSCLFLGITEGKEVWGWCGLVVRCWSWAHC